MKKFITLMLICILLLGCTAIAESAVDFTAMTDDQLHQIIDGARNELTKRELNMSADLVLIEQDGVTVYLTGEYELWGSDNVYIDFEVVVVNDSDKTVSILVDAASINGWDVYGSGVSDTSAGKKQKGTLEFLLTDADISTYEEIEDIELTLTIYDSDEWETISDVEGISIQFN